jgi:nucleotide-binding universal stress UspA family protein
MIETVLCAVDIANANHDAYILEAADQQARLHNAQLDLVTIVPNSGGGMVGGYLTDHHVETALSRARKELNDFATGTLGDDRNAEIRHVVATGRVYTEVLRIADVDKADLIVIGAQHPDLADFLLGPNSARIVRHAKSSVIVVR